MNTSCALAACVVCASVSVAFADEYMLSEKANGAVVVWTDGTYYDGGVAPTSPGSATVGVPAGYTVKVTDDTLTDLSAIQHVQLYSKARLEVDVSTDGTLATSLEPPTNAKGNYITDSTLVKLGIGRLTLGGASGVSSIYQYYIGCQVDKGTLVAPQVLSSGVTSQLYWDVAVAEGAKFVLSSASRSSINGTLTGCGVVTNEGGTVNLFTGSGTFEGAFGGVFRIYVNKPDVAFVGTESTVNHYVQMSTDDAVLTVSKPGMAKSPSSLGLERIVELYVGKLSVLSPVDQACDKTFRGISGATLEVGGPGMLDLTTDSSFVAAADALAGSRLTLAATNADVTSSFAGSIPVSLVGTQTNALSLVKSGIGGWHLADVTDSASYRDGLGDVTVNAGTLGIDILEDVGINCALGRAYGGQTITLGGDDAVLKFTSTTGSVCSTRPIVIAGDAAIESSLAPVKLAGVRPSSGTGLRTLTLRGDNTVVVNGLYDVTNDAASVLAVAKEGAGTWELGGDLDFRGGVAVRGGTLRVRNEPSGLPYRRLRLQMKENRIFDYPDSSGKDSSRQYGFSFCEIAFGGPKSSTYQNVVADSVMGADWANLRPGQWAFYNHARVDRSLGSGQNWFDCAEGTYLECYNREISDPSAGNTVGRLKPSRNDPSTWMQIDFHLAEDMADPNYFDFLPIYSETAGTGNNWASNLHVFNVLGSRDGIHWEQLFDDDHVVDPNGSWCFSSSYYVASQNTKNRAGYRAYVQGFPFDHVATAKSYSVFPNGTKLEVSGGGSFEVVGDPILVNGFAASATASQGGSISNVNLAATAGTIEIRDWPEDQDVLTLPLTFDSSVSGLDNVEDWVVQNLGETKTSRRYYAKVLDGQVKVIRERPGLILLLK